MHTASQSVTTAEAYGIAAGHFQAGRIDEAENICRQILAVEPRNPDALHLMGAVLTRTGHTKKAVKTIEQAIRINKNAPYYYISLGLALHAEGKLFDASRQFERALALDPAQLDAYINLGNVLKEQKKYAAAVERYEQALVRDPGNVLALYNLGHAFQLDGKLHDAGRAYEKALALNPYFPEACTNLGCVYKDLGRFNDAVTMLEKAIALSPDPAEAYNNRGMALNEMGRFEEAAADYNRAIALNPENAEADTNLGIALTRQGNLDAGIDAFKKSVKLNPKNAETYFNMGLAFMTQVRRAEAIEAFGKAAELDPSNANMLAMYVHQLQHICDWDRLKGRDEKLLSMLRKGEGGRFPSFIALCLPTTPAEQLAVAEAFSEKLAVPDNEKFYHKPGRKRGKIRIGYLSADFHQHPTAYLMAQMFELHDRSKFETVAYSYGPHEDSPMRRRLIKAFDTFLDVRPASYDVTAKRIFDDGIDILIDLKGYTGEARQQIVARRPAPVQVNYIGYPGTMGADFVDYIISDKFITPMEHQPFYSERIVQLPDAYQPNDTTRVIGAPPTRAACGLPETGFVFCSFNNTYKITPQIFDIWMRLLKSVPGSVLWLMKSNDMVTDNLLRQTAARGVDPARLVSAPALPLPEHLARHACADLFLDTLPVNAHTTTSDALWAGLPVVTCAGPSFVGRVAGSLLTTCGLADLVTYNLEDYEALALRLAREPALLAGYRQKLAETRLTSPLFDMPRYVKNIEKVYEEMWRIWQAGEPPRAFAV
jgi:protein O-GlcNAc transferase